MKCSLFIRFLSWWRHQMETFSALLAICAGIHRSPMNSPHTGQWRGTLMFSLICARINCWVNNREAGDLRRHRAHYDVIVMIHPFGKRSYYTTCISMSDRPSEISGLLSCNILWKYQFDTWYVHSLGGTTSRVWVSSESGHFDLLYTKEHQLRSFFLHSWPRQSK